MAIVIPQPTAELVITPIYSTRGEIAFLYIYPHSIGAHQWIQEQAPQFGKLTDPSSYMANSPRTLFVHPVYNAYDVMTYLESMGIEDAPEVQE